MADEEESSAKSHRKRQAGPKAEKKKKKAEGKGKSDAQRNPRAFTFQSAVRAARQFHRKQDVETKRHHVPEVDRTPLEPPPVVIGVVGPPKVGKTTLINSLLKNFTRQNLTDIKGPVTVVSGKKRRLTFLECNNDINSMIDTAKIADLVLVLIDASFGFEMEVFEFLNICQVHGFPKIMGVLTHLDLLRNNKSLRKIKKKLKHRFWTEVYQGAKLFNLSGLSHGCYPKTEIHNLGRFISVMKFRPLQWRISHPYVLVDRMEDLTDQEKLRQNIKCDRTVSVYGYVRGTHLKSCSHLHLVGCGEYKMKDISLLPDPCPLPDKEKKRTLNERERSLYAPMSGVGGILYDKDAVYIDLGGSHAHTDRSQPDNEDKEKPSNELMNTLSDTKQTIDHKMATSQLSVFKDSEPIAVEALEEHFDRVLPEEEVVNGADQRKRRKAIFDFDEESDNEEMNEEEKVVEEEEDFEEEGQENKDDELSDYDDEDDDDDDDIDDDVDDFSDDGEKEGDDEEMEEEGEMEEPGTEEDEDDEVTFNPRVMSKHRPEGVKRKHSVEVNDANLSSNWILSADSESESEGELEDSIIVSKNHSGCKTYLIDNENLNNKEELKTTSRAFREKRTICSLEDENISPKTKKLKSEFFHGKNTLQNKKSKGKFSSNQSDEQFKEIATREKASKKVKDSKKSNAFDTFEDFGGSESDSDSESSDDNVDDDIDDSGSGIDSNEVIDEDHAGDEASMKAQTENVPSEEGHLKWKDNILQKAAEAFYARQKATPNLRKLVYGNVSADRGSEGKTDSSDSDAEDTLGGIFKIKSKKKRSEEDVTDGRDCSLNPLALRRDWALDSFQDSIRDCFVTGKWKDSEDAEKLLEEDEDDEELYGDFEDLETGEVHKMEEKEEEQDSAIESGEENEKDEKAEQEKRMEKKKKLKAAFNANYDEDDDNETSYFDDLKAQMNEQAQLNQAEFDDLDDDIRVQYEGYRPGMYVRIELSGMPAEFVINFDPRYPVILGGLLSNEQTIGFVQSRFKKHRWHRKILKSRDPLILSVGWRRFQTLPMYSIQDHNGRHRLLKYTPEHMHCMATFYGPLAAPGTGVLAVQSVAGSTADFRISATGTILDLDKSTTVVKKLKLTGTPLKIFKNTAFIKGMFNSALEVAKFERATIRTVSGVRGQVKRALKSPEGAFRATFEDKILMSDIVFLRTWYPVDIPSYYNPVSSLLLPLGNKTEWQGMRTVGQLRKETGVSAPNNKDSHYKPIVRETRHFNPLRLSKTLQKDLPFKSKPKLMKKRRKPTLETRRAVVMEPDEKRAYTLMTQLYTLNKEKQRKRKEKMAENRKVYQDNKAKQEKKREAKQKEDRRRVYRLMAKLERKKHKIRH